MVDIVVGAHELRELSGKNVILGKNGCGKSFMMKQIEVQISRTPEYGVVRYVSPERGGVLTYEPGIDHAIDQNERWLGDNRRNNQSANFRQQSTTLFRRLELLVLREIEANLANKDYVPQRFDVIIETINTLLERVQLKRGDRKPFLILDRQTGTEAQPSEISSGESELISLAIEILTFVRESKVEKKNVLLIDEPDVHLHPDLQDRLARFIIDALEGKSITLILATHSTALLAGLAQSADTRVAFKRPQISRLTFRPITDVDRAILPIFGAHPLSNVFIQAPILLIEGEDDERVWQQAIRSAGGQIRVFPCVVESVDRLAGFETEVNNLIETVYDNAKGYSLRDRDTGPVEIEDVGNVIRMRLSCRAAENLMLADESLARSGTDWKSFQATVRHWTTVNSMHKYHAQVQAFVNDGFDRKGHDLKDIRNILVGLMSTKPWEVLVGQTIAAFAKSGGARVDGSIRDFLGEKVCDRLLHLPCSAPAT